jgi:hypothetical protein
MQVADTTLLSRFYVRNIVNISITKLTAAQPTEYSCRTV